MKIIEQKELTREQQAQVVRLWNKEYPDTLAYRQEEEFSHYLQGLTAPLHYLLVDEQENLRGWALTFEREGEQWFAIILDSQIHGQGLGSTMLKKLQSKHRVLNGWVIDHDRAIRSGGAPYRSPLGFYLKNGFETVPETRLELEKISAVKIMWGH